MKRSAGTLLYKFGPDREPDPDRKPEGRDAAGPAVDELKVRVLLVHMGGPLWARKDEHAWSIPKGEYTDGENPHDVAAREFAEELGSPLPAGPEFDLGSVAQSGKSVLAFARAADFDASSCVSNTFDLQWPPRSGRMQAFPEVDRAEWFTVQDARSKLVKGQVALLDRLLAHLGKKNSGS